MSEGAVLAVRQWTERSRLDGRLGLRLATTARTREVYGDWSRTCESSVTLMVSDSLPTARFSTTGGTPASCV